MPVEDVIKTFLKSQKVDVTAFVDISGLSHIENKGYANAVLIGIAMSPEFVKTVTNTPDYVGEMKRGKPKGKDEFQLTEAKTDGLADDVAAYLSSHGFDSYSQSEDNITATGYYNKNLKTTPLPHKTIALLAGLGWIGKHNLLISPVYGSAISMCTVLTNAPLKTNRRKPMDSKCGNCTVCKDICEHRAIHGSHWSPFVSRDGIIDVYKCATCLKCMVSCPYTQRYAKRLKT